MPNRVLPLSLAPALAALAAACSGAPARLAPAPRAPIRVEVLTVARGPVERVLEASGTVRGCNTAVLTSRIVAGLREIKVSAGDPVKAGQLLAVLEDGDAQAAVRRARADLTAAIEGRAEAEQAARAAEANARLAGTMHGRMTLLRDKGAATQQAYDEAEARQQTSSADRDRAEARLRGGAARIEEARAALAGAEAALGYTRIAAPFSGRIIDRRVDPGSQASPGMPLLVVEQDGALRVEASVDESHAATVSLGMAAHVELESVGRGIDGKVTEVVPAVDPASRIFVVKVDLPTTPAAIALRPGMFARVRFPIGTEERLTVPTAAVRALGDTDRIFVVEGGRAWTRLVTLGQRHGDAVEVLAGLDPGEVVIAVPPRDLTDGAAVEVGRS